MKYLTSLSVALFLFVGVATAQDLVIYPAEGQSQEQLEKDKFECYGWAKGESGFDPMERATASSAPPPKQASQGGAVRGAARGAATGAVVGGIVGGSKDARTGAKVGAATGGIGGAARKSDQKRQQAQSEQQWAEKEIQQYEQGRAGYNRAYGACLEGRGYSVK